MKLNKQGYGHYGDGINNQDYYFTEDNVKMVLDGCSGAKFAEIGTRLFCQIFSKLPDRLKLECFEDNIKKVFEELLDFFSKWYHTQEEIENFIMDNLLFTIIACFETEDAVVVKMFGDGYIVTVNKEDCVSYMKFHYGNKPPYFAYKYCSVEGYKDYEMKTYIFSKEYFKRVGVATDGIVPIVIGNVDSKKFDDIIVSDSKDIIAEGFFLTNKIHFSDDVTLVI